MYWVITCTLIWICLCNHKYELHTSHCFQYDLISVTTCCHFHGHVSRPTSREVKSLSGYTYSLLPETHITNTPMKFNMETENQPMRRRFLLETMIFRFHLKLWGSMVNLAFLEAAPPAIFRKKLVIEVRPCVKVVRRLYLGNVATPQGQGPPPLRSKVVWGLI